MKDQREYVLTAWNTLKNQSTGAEASEGLIGSIGYNPFIGVANNAMVSADGVVILRLSAIMTIGLMPHYIMVCVRNII